jgi:glycerol-3-phosphate cytidylyltransferase
MIGFTCSTFDLLHAGHVHFLRECRSRCDELWVGLQTDIMDRPEKNRPIQTVYERWSQIDAVKHVDKIIPYESEKDLENMLVTLPPHVRFLGSDYDGRPYTGHHLYTDGSINKMVLIPRRHGWSTSGLRGKIAAAQEKQWKSLS